MSKHKKRVSLAPSTAPAAQAVEAHLAVEAPQVGENDQPDLTPEATEPDVHKADEQEADEQEADEQQVAETRPGIESHPLFWFLLGALTVGIIVLLGLLLMTPSKAAPAAKAAAPAAPIVRAVTPTALAIATRAAEPTQPDAQAIMTAVMERNQSVTRIGLDEAKMKIDAGTVLLVDVRSEQTYAEQHIKGAINIPELDTAARLSEFPRDKEIILYCS